MDHNGFMFMTEGLMDESAEYFRWTVKPHQLWMACFKMTWDYIGQQLWANEHQQYTITRRCP